MRTSAGLFAACPSCAGNLILSLVGIGGSLAAPATSVVIFYQPGFIIASLAALFGPIITSTTFPSCT